MLSVEPAPPGLKLPDLIAMRSALAKRLRNLDLMNITSPARVLYCVRCIFLLPGFLLTAGSRHPQPSTALGGLSSSLFSSNNSASHHVIPPLQEMPFVLT